MVEADGKIGSGDRSKSRIGASGIHRTFFLSAGDKPRKNAQSRCFARASPGVSAAFSRAHTPYSSTRDSSPPRRASFRVRDDFEYEDCAIGAGRPRRRQAEKHA